MPIYPDILDERHESDIDHDALPEPSPFEGDATAKPVPISPTYPAREKSNQPLSSTLPDGMLVLPGGALTITAGAAAIFKVIAKVKGLFFRGGRIHELVNCPDGGSKLDPLIPAQFRSRVEAYGVVCAWRVGANNELVLKPTICPEETAKAMMESTAAREFLPNVVSMSACPVLANIEGKPKVLGKGWHDVGGGVVITGGSTPPDVALGEAVTSLRGLLADFDFASPGDTARALASLIAPALRFGGWLKNPLPIDIGEADLSQSGKTYRQKVVAAIYRETCNLIVQKNGGVGGLDESLAQKLIDGRPFVLFDNMRGKLDSPFLEAILTSAGTIGARVPHRGEIQVDARGFAFQLTSNGVETTRDLANRASIISIRKRPKTYRFKVYAEGELHAHVVQNQPYVLGCVFAIIREWARQGQPRTDENRHDFREWATVLDWISRNILNAGPLLDGHDEARDRVGDPRKIWLRKLCIGLRLAAKLEVHLNASQLAEFATEQDDLLPPSVYEGADEAIVARKIGTIMAAIFSAGEEIVVDGFKIKRDRRYSPKAQKEVFVYLVSAPLGPDSAAGAMNNRPKLEGPSTV